jgi:CBS domain-containing protein/anti-sigma regulatory factor (Ser/Thr protein kinase)
MKPGKEVTRVQELIYEMRVEQVMIKNVITVSPDDPMSKLRLLLRDNRISGVPVTREDRLVGLVSIEDFITCLAEGKLDSPVKTRMTTDVKTVYNTDPLVHAVSEFDRWGYGRFPVVDRKTGKLVGIITKGDIVRGLLKKMEIDYHQVETHRYQAGPVLKDIFDHRTTLIFRHQVRGHDFDQAGEASSRLKKQLQRVGLVPEAVRRITIAAYEAEMNIVIYTDGGELVTRVSPHKVVVEAVDHGPGIRDIEQALQPGFSTAPDWVRELGFGAGMGLTNIRNCSDEMELHSTVGEGTRLRFTVKIDESHGTHHGATEKSET